MISGVKHEWGHFWRTWNVLNLDDFLRGMQTTMDAMIFRGPTMGGSIY